VRPDTFVTGPRRSRAVWAALLLAPLVLAGCGESFGTDIEEQAQASVESAELLPQTLFPGGGAVSECPEPLKDAPKNTAGGVPQAVCVTVENAGPERASFTLNVEVRSRDDDPLVVLSTVTLTTPPIEPGATGSVAVAAPGAEKVIDDFADGQQQAQEAQGLIPSDDVALEVTTITRAAA
jgi:predicted small secreted protein